MKPWLKMLAGSLATYVIVAACSGSEDPSTSPSVVGAADASVDTGGPLDAMSDALATALDAGERLLDGAVDSAVEPTATAHAAESGARLKARWLVSADGAREFVGWRDIQRDEDCAFALAEDGKIRCLPSDGAVVAEFFADDQCTVPMARVATGCASPSYILHQPNQCGEVTGSGVWEAAVAPTDTSTIAAFASSVFWARPAGCESASITGSISDYDFYAASAHAAPSSFSAAAESTDS